MKRKILSVSLLLIGLLILIVFSLIYVNNSVQTTEEVIVTSGNSLVAPAIIDAPDDVVHIPVLRAGLLKSIPVHLGETVKKGQLLFTLDDSQAKNDIQVQQISVEKAQNELLIKKKQLQHAKEQLHRLQRLDKRAVSGAELEEKKYQVSLGEMRLTQAQDNLTLALANLENAKLILSQYEVRAPKAGIVLQINAHVHEFVNSSQPLILLGDAKKIIVRVSLDERDIQRFNPKAAAFLTNSENEQLKIPLRFLNFDHYVVTQDRLNSRVQEILYYFERDKYPKYIAGQQFEANIALRSAA